jgi:putative ABC transport system permease protein
VIPYFDVRFLGAAVLITLMTGILSGYYPALFLSGVHPVKILKTRSNLGFKGLTFRKGLVIFQFSLSIILIISTIIVFKQLLFIRNSSLGYDKDHILCIRMSEDIGGNYEILKNELFKNPDILGVSRTEPLDANVITNTNSVYWEGKTESENLDFRILRADHDFVSTYGITMDEGRFYSRQFVTDETGSLVINEAAARAMGLKSPVGKQIHLWERKGSVIGVLKDFHFGSFHTFIEPLIVVIPSGKLRNLYLRLLSVRFRPGTLMSSTTHIREKWKALIPDVPFDYYFLDDALNAQYRAEQQMGTLFKYFTVFAIFIACMGLYGLASFSAEQKIKEIGIRKVLGATVSSVTVMLSKEFLKWVVLANLIAWPISWFVMNAWLQNFAYRTSVEWWVFVLAGALAFGIALFTISFRTIRSAAANPADALRYE